MKLLITLCYLFISLQVYAIEPEGDDYESRKQLAEWIFNRSEQLQGVEPSPNSAKVAQQVLILFFSQISYATYINDVLLKIPFDFKGVKSLTATNDHTISHTLYFDSINGLTKIDFQESYFEIYYQDNLPIRMTNYGYSDTTFYNFHYKEDAVKIDLYTKNQNFEGSFRVEDNDPRCKHNYDKWSPQCYYYSYYYEDNHSEGYQILCFDSNGSSDTDAIFFSKQQMESYSYTYAPMGHIINTYKYTNQRQIPYEVISKGPFTEETPPTRISIKYVDKGIIQIEYYATRYVDYWNNNKREFDLCKLEKIYLNDHNLPVKHETFYLNDIGQSIKLEDFDPTQVPAPQIQQFEYTYF